MVYEITEDNFQKEVIESTIPCVIEFTAGWCTMCDEMIPRMESLSNKFEDEVRFCVINIDEQKQLRIKFVVGAVPYIVYVDKGMQTPLFDELVTEDRLEDRIRFMLNDGEAPTTRPIR